MPAHLFDPRPNVNQAYYTDGNHEWYGDAPRGAATNEPKWRIYKIEYATPGDFDSSWVIKWAEGSDNPSFVWDYVVAYNYTLLKAR